MTQERKGLSPHDQPPDRSSQHSRVSLGYIPCA
jgi:hypothetical protein